MLHQKKNSGHCTKFCKILSTHNFLVICLWCRTVRWSRSLEWVHILPGKEQIANCWRLIMSGGREGGREVGREKSVSRACAQWRRLTKICNRSMCTMTKSDKNCNFWFFLISSILCQGVRGKVKQICMLACTKWKNDCYFLHCIENQSLREKSWLTKNDLPGACDMRSMTLKLSRSPPIAMTNAKSGLLLTQWIPFILGSLETIRDGLLSWNEQWKETNS